MPSRRGAGCLGATALSVLALAACTPAPRVGAPDEQPASSPPATTEPAPDTAPPQPTAPLPLPPLPISDGGPSAEPPPPDAELIEVPLEGFNPTVYVTPRRDVERPAPLTVVLHGNFDRPEWECDIWRPASARLGWTLCPRGIPRNDVDPALDRWAYPGRGELAREILAGVAKVQALHPGEVTLEGSVLVGFSLGANMSPRLAGMKVLPFRAMVLGEGGYQVTQSIARRAARAGIKRVVYLCGERTICRGRAKSLTRLWRRAGVQTATVVMPGVGHGYPEDFNELAIRVFDALEEEEPP